MTEALSDEEVVSLSEVLRERFLEQQSGSDDVDHRDMEKVRNDPLYVQRFVVHNRGNLDNAYKHMIDSHKWRKSFGINDILWTDIDEGLWKSGMAWNRGYDKDGNNVCILNINLHRKDSKKSSMLHKWIAFSFEMQRRVYPKNKLCMVFDMTGAGLAQMDMDLIKFVVNSFKIYYPNLLSWLLVYNMPWILQAAWKIVQSWLSEGAAAKVKFVTNENICDYIPIDQLLEKFGGNDSWQFDYHVERDRLFEMAMSVLAPGGADGGGEEEEEGDQEEALTPATIERARQVSFSGGLPPTRQSRYGDDEEVRSVSPDQRLLQGGSGRSFRRRQVSRLMSLQENKKPSLLDNAESASLNGSLPVLRRYSADPGTVGVTTIGDVMLSPSTELTFIGKKDSEVTCTLTVTNTSDNSVIYKVKTTAPARYKVRPNVALVDGKSVAKVQVLFTPGAERTSVSQDKFLIQTHTISPETSLPDTECLTEFWRALPHKEIKEHRMHCRWLLDSPPKPALKEVSVTATKAIASSSPASQQLPATPIRVLELKVTQLCTENLAMKATMGKVLTLNYILVSLVLVLLFLTYFY